MLDAIRGSDRVPPAEAGWGLKYYGVDAGLKARSTRAWMLW
jgi:hypothetical protein